MAVDEWGSYFTPPPQQDWTYSMPQAGDLLRPQVPFDLSMLNRSVAPTLPNFNLQSNARSNPFLFSMTGEAGPGGGSGGGGPAVPTTSSRPNFMSRMGGGVLDLIKKNPAAFLAMLGAGGAGVAGLVKGTQRAKLPGEVQSLVNRATAPQQPDAYEEAELDRRMRRDIGPGWETSTPGIQAKAQQQYLRQKGDQGAAAAALGPVGSLYAATEANKSREQESLFQLAALLGTLGLGAFSGRQPGY